MCNGGTTDISKQYIPKRNKSRKRLIIYGINRKTDINSIILEAQI